MIATIACKELRALFASPLAWSVLGVVQLALAWVFLMRLDTFLDLQPRLAQLANAPGATEIVVAPLYSAAAIILLMATPLLSMRLIAEERRNQTMTFLVSAPLSMTQIALGKFAGLAIFLLLVPLLAALVGVSLALGGPIDFGLVAANTLGLALLALCFAAVGLYVSSLVVHPAAAAIGTLGLLLASWLAAIGGADSDSPATLLSAIKRFESFNRGLVDSADLAWFAIVIVLFLALAIRRLDRDRLVG